MEEEINKLREENKLLKTLMSIDKRNLDYWVDVVEKAIEVVEEIKLHYQNNPTMIPSVKIDKLESILKGGID